MPESDREETAVYFFLLIKHVYTSSLQYFRSCFCVFRQVQQQQAELEVHPRDSLSSYDLSQVGI